MRTPILVALVLAVSIPARAQAPGLYAEQSTTVDGVNVRRVRDTVTGAVCYLAVFQTYGEHTTAAISCLPAVPSFQPFSSPYKEKLRDP